MGSTEFLLYYFFCGIGAGLATLLINNATGLGMVPVVGASGAIYGLLLAFRLVLPRRADLHLRLPPPAGAHGSAAVRGHRDRRPVLERPHGLPLGCRAPHAPRGPGLRLAVPRSCASASTPLRSSSGGDSSRYWEYRDAPALLVLRCSSSPPRSRRPRTTWLFIRPWIELEPLVRIEDEYPIPVEKAQSEAPRGGPRAHFGHGVRLDLPLHARGQGAARAGDLRSSPPSPRCPGAARGFPRGRQRSWTRSCTPASPTP